LNAAYAALAKARICNGTLMTDETAAGPSLPLFD
jgi:hypothetical protein